MFSFGVKPPVCATTCDPYRSPLGSAVLGTKKCANSEFVLDAMKKSSFHSGMSPLPYSERVRRFYDAVTTPVVERFNECVNDGTVRVSKEGPLGEGEKAMSEPSAVCGFVKDSSEKASSAYASVKATANTCIAHGTYGTDTYEGPAGAKDVVFRTPNRLCGFAKAATDGYITPGMASASSAWTSFKGMFSGKIFGREVTGKDVGTVVAAVVAAVVTVKAVQWLMTPAKKKVSGFNLKF